MSTQTSFPIFEDNQVLTSSQLNDLRDFMDEENRLTRTKLIGMGIGCGLNVTFDDGPTKKILISSGVGTTSEGYLITLGDCETTRYRQYTLPQNSFYDPFMTNKIQDVTLYELLTPTAPTLPSDVIVTLNAELAANPTFLNDKAVILFVEKADIDQNSCLGASCDEFGLTRFFTVRKLLVSLSDLNLIIGRCEGFGVNRLPNPLFPAKYDLPDTFMRRALFDPNQPHSSNYFDFSLNYATRFRSDIFPTLLADLKQTYDVYSGFLSSSYNNTNPFLDSGITALIATWTNFLNGTSTGPSYLGMQYFYDFVKDLILAYNEFRDVAFELVSECCGNMKRFPQHLMLGEVLPTGECHPSAYRQEFIYSRIHDSQKLLLDEAISLHKRIILQMRSFKFDLINDPAAGVLVRITPSFEKKSYLTQRAVPYYYDLNSNFPLTSAIAAQQTSLSLNWDHDLVRKCKIESGIVQLVSYENQDVNQLVDQNHIKTPFYYDIDNSNFYRIEGHLKKSYTEVENTLKDIKELFDLPFNVVSLRLRGEPFEAVEDRCNFEDLRSLYQTIRARLLCMMDDACSRLVTTNQTKFEIAKFPRFLTLLLQDCNALIGNQSVLLKELPKSVVSTPDGVDQAKADSFETPLEALANDLRGLAVDLCDRLDIVKTLLPFEFNDFDYGAEQSDVAKSFIKSWIDVVNTALELKLAFNRVLDFVLRNTKSRPTTEMYFVLSQYAAEYIAMLNKIIEDCTYRELEILFYTYRYRVNYIKNNDPTLFSTFIKKHPGIDHKAGVQPGGTFILVYNGDDITVDIKTRDEAILISQHLVSLRCREQVLLSKPRKTKQEFLELTDIQFQIHKCIHTRGELFTSFAGGVSTISIQQVEIAENQVIADFCLPYLCCCDCDCDSIPAPGEVELGLPNVLVPVFVEYNMGDYAFGREIVGATAGCSGPLPITINVKQLVPLDLQKTSRFRLRLIQNGAIRVRENPPGTAFVDGFHTLGGIVRIITSSADNNLQELNYAPDTEFTGVDTFQYMFETLDAFGNVTQSSTPGRVVVHVMNNCAGLQSGDFIQATIPLP